MATDGSQKLDWSGNAFPFLPSWLKPKASESYADARNVNQHSSSSKESSEKRTERNIIEQDRTGTWNGPAPRGFVSRPTHAADEPASVPVAVNEPDYVTLPKGGKMPLIGLGTFKLDNVEAVKTALDVGYRHFDCATIYGNEDMVGQGIKDFCSDEENRKQLWITSKVWNTNHRPEAVHSSVQQTLTDLGCGYLDLLLIHWPHAWVPNSDEEDTGVTIRETWAAMEELVDHGKVRYLGVSNFSLADIEDMLSWTRIHPVVNQIELHPLLAQRKLVGVCARKGVRCVAYSPLGHSKTDLLEHPEVVRIAQETGKTPAQVLLRWNVQRGVAVIPKAGSTPHVEENIKDLFTWRLSWDQKAALDALDEGKRFIEPKWHTFPPSDRDGGATKPSEVLL